MDLLVSNTIKQGVAGMVTFHFNEIKLGDTPDKIAIEATKDRIVGLYKDFKLLPGQTRVSFLTQL